MPSPTSRRSATALGLHVADDAVRVARVALDERGRPRLAGWWSFGLPPGCVHEGLVRHAGQLPADVAAALRQAVGDAPVRVALASPDVACVPLTQATGDPVATLASRLPGGESGDALWADAVSIAGVPVGLAGARRSTVLRTRDAVARAGVRVAAIDPMPGALAAAVLGLLDVPVATWTAQLAHAGIVGRVTVGRGGRLEGGAVPWPDAAPRFTLHVQAPGAAVHDAADQLRRTLGRVAYDVPDAEVPALALAVGAALGGLDGPVGSPDLASAVVVRPIGPADPLPRWAVESLAVSAGPPGPRARRARRGAP